MNSIERARAEFQRQDVDTAFIEEVGAVNALEGLIAWLGELGEKHPDFAGSTDMAALYVERYTMDNFPQWKREKE